MSDARSKDPVLALRFHVEIDGVELGSFTACEGLVVEYEFEEVKEGGNNGYTTRLPGRRKYTPIKLTRPVDSSSGAIAAYFTKVGTSFTPATGRISAWNGEYSDTTPVATWELTGVWPLKYTGPSFSVTGATVVTESLSWRTPVSR